MRMSPLVARAPGHDRHQKAITWCLGNFSKACVFTLNQKTAISSASQGNKAGQNFPPCVATLALNP